MRFLMQPSTLGVFFAEPARNLSDRLRRNKYARAGAILCAAYLALFAALKLVAIVVIDRPLFRAPYSAFAVSANGRMLAARIARDEQWRFRASGPLPDKYIQALTSYEDRRFFYHPGLDPGAVLRAAWSNIRAGKIKSGGSTISMQVMRMARGNRRRTFAAKGLESVLAIFLELRYSKREILELYAAHAPFGGNTVGLEAAARRYFGRAPARLSWAESCLFAVLPNSPALIHPGRNRGLLMHKRDELLQYLFKIGRITDIELELALAEPLPLPPRALRADASHLLETLYVRDRRRGDGSDYFPTTLNAQYQRRLAHVLASAAPSLRARNIHNAAAVIIDNRSGHVVAYIGNIQGAKRGPRSGSAMDIAARSRSTGSILKPFLYAAMLEAGEILPKTLVPDVPTHYGSYLPRNFDRTFRGAVEARYALARSLNAPAVRLLRRHGGNRFHEYLRRLGMTTLHRSADGYGLTLIVGGAEGNLAEMTAMYARLARSAQGLPAGPLRITPNGTPFAPGESPGRGASYLTLRALLETARPELEAYWRRYGSPRKIAWKTGTSYGMRDAWAMGVTPEFTIGVWVGNADGRGIAGMTGTSTAGPILFDAFSMLGRTTWFKRPENHLKQQRVCDESGYLPAANCETAVVDAPRDANFTRVSPYHRLVHLDAKGLRVNSACESKSAMRRASWFVLPPSMEHYYRRLRPDYRRLPPMRSDCSLAGRGRSLSIVYPGPLSKLYPPIELGGKRGRVIFSAAHRRPETTIFWHLNDKYLGKTRNFHKLAHNPSPGRHRLVLVDEYGTRAETSFEVLE